MVAVSKTKPLSAMEEYARAAGAAHQPVVFGENYIQEIATKHDRLPEGSQLHMIGPLQSNKIRGAVAMCDVIESAHSEKTIEGIAKEVAKIGKRQRIFLQVNIGRDELKSGFAPEEIEKALEICARHPDSLEIEGLMTILPYSDNREASRPHYRALNHLREDLLSRGFGERFSRGQIKLSMGMSDDFEVAIEEGADLVRIGTALFGER